MMHMPANDSAPAVAKLIHVDEIGIETGHWGDFFVKTSYRPIYRLEGGMLTVSALEADAAVLRDWQRQPEEAIFGGTRDEQAMAEALCVALHIRNHANMLHDSLRLWLDCRPRHSGDVAAMVRAIGQMRQHMGRTALEPSMITCIVADAREPNEPGAFLLADALRAQGLCVAIDNFGASRDGPALLDTISPDVVRIDAELVRAMGAVPRGRGLLGALVEALHAGDMAVAVAGIATAAEMETVLAAAPELLCGPLLAPCVLAGEPIEREKIDPAQAIRPGTNVIAFRR